MKVSIIPIVVLVMLTTSWFGENLFAELTKSDAEEIRKIMKEDIQHVNKRIDDLRDTLRSEISDVKTANKDIKSEIKDVGLKLKICDLNCRVSCYGVSGLCLRVSLYSLVLFCGTDGRCLPLL